LKVSEKELKKRVGPAKKRPIYRGNRFLERRGDAIGLYMQYFF